MSLPFSWLTIQASSSRSRSMSCLSRNITWARSLMGVAFHAGSAASAALTAASTSAMAESETLPITLP